MYEVKISCVLTIKDKCKQEKKVPNLTILIRIHDTQREDFFFKFQENIKQLFDITSGQKDDSNTFKKKDFSF